MAIFIVCRLASLLVWTFLLRAAGDAPAQATLKGMMKAIKSGQAEDNFNHEGVLTSDKPTLREEIGGCLMDKVGALVIEDGLADFVNELQVDLAACCMKSEPCPPSVSEAYDLMHKVNKQSMSAAAATPKAAALLIQAAATFVEPEALSKQHAALLSRCRGSVDSCTMEELHPDKFKKRGEYEL
mmetsp:Transcript_52420/g.125236  ORF Transcript_52420/g.125236 Transcript_52420/m.125236 type:complete len:184 (-) Transcript_52420:5-556(-)